MTIRGSSCKTRSTYKQGGEQKLEVDRIVITPALYNDCCWYTWSLCFGKQAPQSHDGPNAAPLGDAAPQVGVPDTRRVRAEARNAIASIHTCSTLPDRTSFCMFGLLSHMQKPAAGRLTHAISPDLSPLDRPTSQAHHSTESYWCFIMLRYMLAVELRVQRNIMRRVVGYTCQTNPSQRPLEV